MHEQHSSPQEICQRGDRWYEQHIRGEVETPENIGKVLVINVETGEYEMDADHLTALLRAQSKHPTALFYGMRIGYPALAKMGGRWRMASR